MSSNPPMETESIPRLLVRSSGPAIAGLLAHALYNITDRVFVGRTVGSEGLAALSLAFPFMLLFIAFGILVGVGTSSRMAIQLGEKDAPGAAVTLALRARPDGEQPATALPAPVFALAADVQARGLGERWPAGTPLLEAEDWVRLVTRHDKSLSWS